jgi:hypothetical protein
MSHGKKLGSAAEQLLDILERSVENIPGPERDAKWRALNGVVAKIGSRAKSQAKPKILGSLRVARRRA